MIATLLDEDLEVTIPDMQSAQVFQLDWNLTDSAGIPVPDGIYCVSVVAEEFEISGDVAVDRDFQFPDDLAEYCQ